MRGGARAAALALALAASAGHAAVLTVAPQGGDFATVQAALDAARAGDTVQVRAGVYPEQIVFPASGDAAQGFISLEAAPGETPVLDGAGLPAGNFMVLIDGRSFVRLEGFEIRNNRERAAIRVTGAGSHVELRRNHIHDIRGEDAMAISVYGTAPEPISHLVIDGNLIHDCEPAESEALVLNGNISDFEVTDNVVRDVNNIGIDFIGGETDIQPDPNLVARNGVCRGNTVIRANSNYGGGAAGGLYVDGGRDILIENNLVTESDFGLEVGAENRGLVTSGIVVRNNVFWANEKTCMVFGGFDRKRGRVRDSIFEGNTCFGNDTLSDGNGELWIQFAEGNVVRNNVFYGTAQNRLLSSDEGNVGNQLDYNFWFTPGGAPAEFIWNGTRHPDFAAFQAGTGQGAHSRFADPGLADPARDDFHLTPGSPAVDAGDPTFAAAAGETDVDGGARVTGGAVDVGADELTVCGDGVVEVPETCDDGGLVDGDGCDSNCTPTACGNGIVTAGEACDDGNLAAGDCCSPACAPEAAGVPCTDGIVCTTGDACDGGGRCAGVEAPAAGCRVGSGRIVLRHTGRVRKDKLVWTWRGPGAVPEELGNPVSGRTSYDLCVYDEAGLLLHARVRGGRQCGERSCWKGGRKGYRYRDPRATAGGVRAIVLAARRRTALELTGKGPRLGLAGLRAPGADLSAELRNTEGVCWAHR